MSLNENPVRPGEPKVSSFNDILKQRRMGTPADERLQRAELFPSEQKTNKKNPNKKHLSYGLMTADTLCVFVYCRSGKFLSR